MFREEREVTVSDYLEAADATWKRLRQDQAAFERVFETAFERFRVTETIGRLCPDYLDTVHPSLRDICTQMIKRLAERVGELEQSLKARAKETLDLYKTQLQERVTWLLMRDVESVSTNYVIYSPEGAVSLIDAQLSIWQANDAIHDTGVANAEVVERCVWIQTLLRDEIHRVSEGLRGYRSFRENVARRTSSEIELSVRRYSDLVLKLITKPEVTLENLVRYLLEEVVVGMNAGALAEEIWHPLCITIRRVEKIIVFSPWERILNVERIRRLAATKTSRSRSRRPNEPDRRHRMVTRSLAKMKLV